ncbi:hypothetical protein BDD12DRAFT_287823 [Trichophaea hybrida]|nr:hypothetical protein BDD12DRAFT_287823 [Trichophaea hybrida]
MRFEPLALLAIASFAAAQSSGLPHSSNITISSGHIIPSASPTYTNGTIGTTIIKSSGSSATATTTKGTTAGSTATGSAPASSSTGNAAPGTYAINSFGAFVLAIGAMAAGQLV